MGWARTRASRARRILIFGLIAAAIVFLYSWHLGARSFWEPDEPRYAEIGREMLVSGDWVIPRLNFIKYYEKPPLTYWIVGASFAIFGVSEGAARLGPAIAALLFILAAWVIGRVFYGARTAGIGALILALSPLSWAAGRLLLTDMFLSVGVAWAVAGYALALRGKAHERSPTIAMGVMGAGLATAVLAKGPIGLVIPLFGIVPFRVLAGKAAAIGVRGWASAAILFGILATPWFALISWRDPAFAWFFFVHEHLLRYVTPEAHREGAFYYYLAILLLGLFPSSFLIPWAARRTWPGLRPETDADRGTLLLGCMGILTLLFFSASRSKLASYIVPAAPALALVTARALALAMDSARAGERRRGSGMPAGLRASLAFASLMALAGAISIAVLTMSKHELSSMIPGVDLYALSGLLIALSVLLGAPAVLGGSRALGPSLVACAAILFILLLRLNTLGERLDPLQSVEQAARFVAARARPGDVVASYGTLLQGLTFYANRRTTIIGGAGELAYGAGLEPTGEWIVRRKEVPTLLERRRAFVVVPKRLEASAVADSGGRLRRILDGPRFCVLSSEP